MSQPLPGGTVSDPATDQNFRKLTSDLDGLERLIALLGFERGEVGSGTLTWTASATSAAKEISHSLGVAPAVIFPQLNAGVLSSTVIESKDEDSFTIKGFLNGSFSVTIGFDWIALA